MMRADEEDRRRFVREKGAEAGGSSHRTNRTSSRRVTEQVSGRL